MHPSLLKFEPRVASIRSNPLFGLETDSQINNYSNNQLLQILNSNNIHEVEDVIKFTANLHYRLRS